MKTIHCRILQNEYQDVPGRDVTPAEALILRYIHDPGAATQAKAAANEAEKGNCWKFLRNVKPGGVAQTVIDEDSGKTRKRTNAEEAGRLRRKYLMRGKGGQGTHILDDIFPGENPDLPETFEEIGLIVPEPAEPPAKEKKAAA